MLFAFFVFLLIGCSTVSDDISSEYYNIGNAYSDVGNFEKAIEYYLKALRDDHPSINKIRFNLAVAYIESGRLEDGVKYLQILLDEDSENISVLQSLAYAYYLLGDRDGALLLYDKILSIFEYDTTALFNKSLILLDDENLDDAQNVLEKLYEVDQSIEVVRLLGSVYKDRGEWDSLIRIYEMSLIGEEQDQQILIDLIEYYEEEELYYKAIEFIELLLREKELDRAAEFMFKKGSIQILKLHEFNDGFDFLKESVESGFSNTERIRELVEAEGLLQADQLKDYFTSKNLY